MVAITISGVHVNLDERVKTHINEKIGALSRFHQGLSKVHVTVHNAEKNRYRVDVDMHLGNHKDVVAHDAEDTIHAAIDVVSDKCASQLRKIHARDVHAQRHADQRT